MRRDSAPPHPRSTCLALGAALALALAPTLAPGLGARAQHPERLSPEERAEIDLLRREGQVQKALETLEEVLAEDPGDARSRALQALCRFAACDYEAAVEDATRAFHELASTEREAASAPDLAYAARVRAEILVELGRADEALETLERAGAALQPARDPRDAWALGSALLATGQRERALAALREGARASGEAGWDALLARARCQRRLGDIRAAAQTLVAADRLAARGSWAEPDVLVELGDVYFEAYGEVDDGVSLAHSPAELYHEALRHHPEHEGARLGLFELHRFNWQRQRYRPRELLEAIFAARPASIRGLVAELSAALDDGELVAARAAERRLATLAPDRRDVRTERAALAWIEHRRDGARELLEGLLAPDPADARPEREVGRHLLELYRFAEGVPFLASAVERDPGDWVAWAQYGRALANTGDEDAAREALDKAVEVADGRRDAWRDNTKLVLDRMATSLVERDAGELTFLWKPDAAFVFETYFLPFYAEAREELAARYGYTPGPVKIEIFRRWSDFSVRSTGFEGFPALGVCFGPVVTSVSPLSELRGGFSWARTCFHEFTHVIHLGLSHNRCPRWITEGLATWEEGTRNPAWWRNMRRDLVDARANGQILPVRQLNHAFRGPRILFAYYQGGLLCKMLVAEHGFAPMVRLLQAFDRGLDLDQAFREVFQRTPEDVDRAFLGFVDRELAGLSIEPRWDAGRVLALRFGLDREPPAAPEARVRWGEDWSTVAWGLYQAGQRVDAEEALRRLRASGELPARARFLEAEMHLARGDEDAALASYDAAFAAGGEDYRARMARAELLVRKGQPDRALVELAAAERVFPGYPEPELAAEMKLADVYDRRGETDLANEARMRWLGYNAGDFDHRVGVAAWLDEKGRHAESVRWWNEANEVDPFRRFLHHRWALALRALGRHEEALRELEVGIRMPAELDVEASPAESPFLPETDPATVAARWRELEPVLLGLKALSLFDLERPAEARAAAEAALAIDPDEESARKVLQLAQ